MPLVAAKDGPYTPPADLTQAGRPEPGQRVYIVDDDDAARSVVVRLVASMNVPWSEFSSGEAFLGALPQLIPAGCIVSDIRLSGISGPQLQKELRHRGFLLPIVFVTGFADVRLAVQVMQAGAVTLLEKPFRQQELWEAIQKALSQDTANRKERARRQAFVQRISELTTEQRHVLSLVLLSQSNKEIALRLGLTLRTVEKRRSCMFQKMQAESVADLVRMTLLAGYDPCADLPPEPPATQP
jgi:FixJ family two-component response regulator